MEFSINQLLENFTDNKLVAPKAIEKKLGISDDDTSLRKLQVALDALEKVGILEKDKGRYRRVGEDGYLEGRLRCSSKGFCFAIQDVEGAEDVYIRESRLSTAWNGDRVLVKVTKDGIRRRSPEGEVRLIVERANPTLLAKVKATDSGYRAVPLDDRLLFEVELIADENVPDLSVALDKLIHLEIARYPLGSHLPKGRIVQVLGHDAESTADVDLVCCKHNLPRKFSEKAIAAIDKLPKTIKKTDLKHRLDLREITTVKIGNSPAISISGSEFGWNLGIHIPDVAAYITSGSPLDEAARSRIRTVYLGDTILPMLPDLEILNQLEHLTISVLFKLNPQGVIEEFEIQPSVVSVHTDLTYEAAQEILNVNNPADGDQTAETLGLVRDLATVGLLLKQQRPESFSISLPQVATLESDEGMRGILVVPEALPVYGLVAEIMLLTNRAIATHLTALGLPGVYRGHQGPEVNKLTDWLKLLDSMGVNVELANPEQVQPVDYQKFLQAIDQIELPNSRDILKYLLLSLLKPGEYSFTPVNHFGLAFIDKPYLHAIIPQHRYADLLVQRILHFLFEEGRDRRSSRIKEGVDLHSSTCHDQVNWGVLPPERERQLTAEIEFVINKLTQHDVLYHKALSDLEGLQKAEFMRAHTGKNFYGIITGVQSYGFFVEIESLLVEGLVHVSSLKDDWYEFPQANVRSKNRASTVLVGRRSGRQYSLGNRVEVQVKSVDYYRQQIDLVAVASTENMDGLEPIERPEESRDDLDMSRDRE